LQLNAYDRISGTHTFCKMNTKIAANSTTPTPSIVHAMLVRVGSIRCSASGARAAAGGAVGPSVGVGS